jgi:mevalonate pyrophosphate decarboxylase
MDAGPQVKIATLSRHVAEIRRRIAEIAPEARQIEAAAGDGARAISKQDYEAGLS